MEKQPPLSHGNPEEYNTYIEDGEDEKIVQQINESLAGGRIDEADRLKELLERRITVFNDYEKGISPTYTSYANIIDKLLTETAEIDDAETKEAQMLAEGRVKEIRSAVRRYIDRFVKYHHAIKGLNAERITYEDFAKADSDRRRVHDALTATLTETGKTIAKLRHAAREYLNTDVRVRAYPSGMGDADGDALFDLAFLNDRDHVRNWAVAAWTIEQIRQAKEKAAEDRG